MKKRFKKIYLLSILLLIGSFFYFDFVFARFTQCPNITTVSGTNVTFVGEITDTGGDVNTTAWFDYGRTSFYGQRSSESNLTSTGIYCVTVSDLSPCTTYHYRAVARNSAGISYGENKTFTTACAGTTVDIKANNSDGPITILHNTSATLTWTSANATSCTASGAWSGTRAISGSESTGSLTNLRTYTITCKGSGGSVSDSVSINIETVTPTPAEFSVRKTFRNISQGAMVFSDLIYANPGEMLVIGIGIQAGNDPLHNILVKDVLPTGLIYQGDLRVDGVLTTGNILTGLNIGNLGAGQIKTVTFRADVAGAANFSFGQTELTNTALVSSGNVSRSDDAKIVVSRAAVAGIATQVPTGLTNNLFFDSFFLPLLITLLIIWLLKSRIFNFEEWLDLRKKQYQVYKSNKMLQMRIARVRVKEFFKQRI